MLNKKQVNAAVDALSFAAFLLVTSTGVVLRYILPRGSGDIAGRGTGRMAAEKTVATIWGMTRAQWGDIHFWLSVILMAVLAVHLFVHWQWIACVIKGKKKEESGIRAALGFIGLICLVVFAVVPVLTPAVETPRKEFRQAQETVQNPPAEEKAVQVKPAAEEVQQATRHHDRSMPDIQGSMSLQEVSDKSGVPVKVLIDRLGLPEHTSPNQRMGRLVRRYSIDMDKVRDVIAGYCRQSK